MEQQREHRRKQQQWANEETEAVAVWLARDWEFTNRFAQGGIRRREWGRRLVAQGTNPEAVDHVLHHSLAAEIAAEAETRFEQEFLDAVAERAGGEAGPLLQAVFDAVDWNQIAGYFLELVEDV